MYDGGGGPLWPPVREPEVAPLLGWIDSPTGGLACGRYCFFPCFSSACFVLLALGSLAFRSLGGFYLLCCSTGYPARREFVNNMQRTENTAQCVSLIVVWAAPVVCESFLLFVFLEAWSVGEAATITFRCCDASIGCARFVL